MEPNDCRGEDADMLVIGLLEGGGGMNEGDGDGDDDVARALNRAE